MQGERHHRDLRAPRGGLRKAGPVPGARPSGERKVSFGPLSCSWYEQSGQRDCSQISFGGCSQGNPLLGFLHVPNRKASVPQRPALTSPRRGSHTDLPGLTRPEKTLGSSRKCLIP